MNSWAGVPRGSTNQTTLMGGYWIDQNSGGAAAVNPWTANSFGGLCALCHDGTPGDDQAWSPSEIDAIDQFTSSGDWVSGANGHANSVKGSSGLTTPAGRNIFDARGGTGATYSDNPSQHFDLMDDPGDNGGSGFRGSSEGSASYQPVLAQCPRMWSVDEWTVDETGATTESGFHQFSCAKCHVPHASRLPRLMKSNCLDTKHNTWDNTYQTSALGTNNTGRSLSNWTSAQNCHRLGGNDTADTRDAAGVGAGWNNVTPW